MVQGEDALKIGVIGLGYIGSVTAAVLAEQGNQVIGIDNVESKVQSFKMGNIPIYEPSLKEMLKNVGSKLNFSTSYDDLRDVEAAFIAVPTPTRDGKIDISYVLDAARSLHEVNRSCVIVIKSTVVPGTSKEVSRITGMKVVSNPEFTREGTAIHDTVSPDRVVIGGNDEGAVRTVDEIWGFTSAPVVLTTNENAELIKYASNAFLATKISFINEMANLCELIPGADVETVARGMGLDKRIGERFLKAGIGYGGSCFPKDTIAIAAFARESGTRLRIIETASEVNGERIKHAVQMIRENAGKPLKEAKICVLGVAFKDSTDDIRESQSLKLINELIPIVGEVSVYDPIVKQDIKGTTKCSTKEQCIDKSDVLVIATEWPEFRELPMGASKKFIVDVRRILEPGDYEHYTGIGLGNA